MRLKEQKRNVKHAGTGHNRKLFLPLGLKRPGRWAGAGREGNSVKGAGSELVLGKKNLEPPQPE